MYCYYTWDNDVEDIFVHQGQLRIIYFTLENNFETGKVYGIIKCQNINDFYITLKENPYWHMCCVYLRLCTHA
jgi:hypothetical protein